MGKKKPKVKSSKPGNAAESNLASIPSKTDIEAIAVAICSANQAVFMKVCRLCESKDGPFLNIFDADKSTFKKIDEIMPFGIAENDDLPHKICFRCSAKVEELYEFIQKCIKTQHNLNNSMGKKEPILTKTRTRTIWEEKLNKSNMSNDDICDALIKKAMEGIKDIPLKPLPFEEESSEPILPAKKVVKSRTESPKPGTEVKPAEDVNLKQVKVSLDKCDKKFIPTRSSRSQKPESLLDGLPDYKKKKSISKLSIERNEKVKEDNVSPKPEPIQINSDDTNSSDSEESVKKPIKPPSQPKPVPKEPTPPPVESPKPFDIMDHVSMIKVNGVGVLFQCRLCNRNFLKKEVVVTHGCAKNGVPKVDFTKHLPPPEPPKIPTVKYINMKTDGEPKKPSSDKCNTKVDSEPSKPIVPETKPKPRIGPASKVKRINNHDALIGMTVAPITDEKSNGASSVSALKDSPPKDPPTKPVPKLTPETLPTAPSVEFPTAPSLGTRYKLVPGPNNTFQLLEEKSAPGDSPESDSVNTSKKRKSEDHKHSESKKSKHSESKNRSASSPEVINLEEQPPITPRKSNEQPYPVGLFQTLPHPSGIYTQAVAPETPTFTTPAMKKQSYTIVQTGNPSKLLISTKPQPPLEEVPKKRVRKNRHEIQTADVDKQPFNVTLEDAAHPKDHGFFNFINVDPLLQPSYVLPTDNIIQESQISTSTSVSKATTENKDKEKDKYTCNMCGEIFSREKKLLAHIHSHYSKMDEEDMQREKINKRRKK